MHYLNVITRLFISLFLIISLNGYAGGKTYESTGEYLDDMAITSKVKTTILGDSKLNYFQVNVTTYRGVVQLSGFVDNASSLKRATDLTKSIKGVRSVNNSLIVK